VERWPIPKLRRVPTQRNGKFQHLHSLFSHRSSRGLADERREMRYLRIVNFGDLREHSGRFSSGYNAAIGPFPHPPAAIRHIVTDTRIGRPFMVCRKNGPVPNCVGYRRSATKSSKISTRSSILARLKTLGDERKAMRDLRMMNSCDQAPIGIESLIFQRNRLILYRVARPLLIDRTRKTQ
jgi:hypothetical protein